EPTYDSKIHSATNTNGRYDASKESCPYVKNSQSAETEGIIYIVNGCGGSNGRIQSTYPHDAMVYSNSQNGGSLLLEIEGNRLDGKFIADDGSVKDQFSIFKDVNKSTTLKLEANQRNIPLTASWNGTYNWQHDNTKSATVAVAPTVTTKYIVQDDQKCLQDEFTVKVTTSYAIKDFNLTVTKSGMAIDWLTTQERGIVQFTIEKQANGGEFKPIAVIPTKAKNQFSDKNLFYRYLDTIRDNTQTVNYRIKTTDNEGISYYSSIKTVSTVLNIAD
ncbi:MAG: hypothetical protein MUF58_17895, partial [Arcicella sp.]|nr:hypothetical protein [Arcicella sp.]